MLNRCAKKLLVYSGFCTFCRGRGKRLNFDSEVKSITTKNRKKIWGNNKKVSQSYNIIIIIIIINNNKNNSINNTYLKKSGILVQLWKIKMIMFFLDFYNLNFILLTPSSTFSSLTARRIKTQKRLNICAKRLHMYSIPYDNYAARWVINAGW